MSQIAQAPAYRPLRLQPIDLGVALAVLAALIGGLLLRGAADGRMTTFQSEDVPLQFSYPADWREVGTLQDVLVNVEDPYVDSPVKTTFTVQARELDPASQPPLEELVNRQIDERSTLMGYHFLASGPATVGGANGTSIAYAYVIQPIDEPRRPSLPVVVQAREYVIVAGDRSYYFTMIAPENDAERASRELERIIRSVRL